MMHRALLGLAASGCLIACLGNTTSLGGQTSANTLEDGGPAEEAAPVESDPDAAPPSSGGLQCVGRGYTWAPEATAGECEYLLPTKPYDDPDYDPATWDPSRVWIEAWIPNVPESERQGRYRSSLENCGTTADGWYYVQNGGQAPTHFALCPATCTFVANDDVLLRMTSWKPSCD